MWCEPVVVRYARYRYDLRNLKDAFMGVIWQTNNVRSSVSAYNLRHVWMNNTELLHILEYRCATQLYVACNSYLTRNTATEPNKCVTQPHNHTNAHQSHTTVQTHNTATQRYRRITQPHNLTDVNHSHTTYTRMCL